MSTSALSAIVAALQASSQPAPPQSDPVVLTSVLAQQLTGKLDKTGDASGTGQTAQDAAQASSILPMPRIAKSIPRDRPLSPFWWIDPAREWGIRNGVDVADTQPMLQSALNAGEDLDLGSGGRFWLSDKLAYKRQCQRIVGSRPFSFEFQYRYGASLCVANGRSGYPSFNLSATSVVEQTHECVLSGVGISFWHPGSAQLGRAPALADLIRYPWAIDLTKASRSRLYDVQLQRAWNGINGNANASGTGGGAWNWRDLELCCFNEIYHIGCTGTDFFTADNIRAWVFGVSGTEFEPIYNAAGPYATIEGVDGGYLKGSTFWRSRLIYNNPSNLGFNLGDLDFDGGAATGPCLLMVGGRANAEIVKINSDAQQPGLRMGGTAKLITNQIDIRGVGAKTASNPLILCNGGGAVLQSSVTRLLAVYDNTNAADNRCQTIFALCTAGEMNLGETRVMGINNVARTQPAIWQQGSGGRVSITNLRADDIGTGSGTLLQIESDIQHTILGVQKLGWTVTLPTTQNFGNYIGIK